MDLNWWEKDINIQLTEQKKSQLWTLEQGYDFLPDYTHIFLSKFFSARKCWMNIGENGTRWSAWMKISGQWRKSQTQWITFQVSFMFLPMNFGGQWFYLVWKKSKTKAIFVSDNLAYSKGSYLLCWPILWGLLQVWFIADSFTKKGSSKELMIMIHVILHILFWYSFCDVILKSKIKVFF